MGQSLMACYDFLLARQPDALYTLSFPCGADKPDPFVHTTLEFFWLDEIIDSDGAHEERINTRLIQFLVEVRNIGSQRHGSR